jgi:hypothetical protein
LIFFRIETEAVDFLRELVEGGSGAPSARGRDLKNIAQKFENLEDALRIRKRKRGHTQNYVPTEAT